MSQQCVYSRRIYIGVNPSARDAWHRWGHGLGNLDHLPGSVRLTSGAVVDLGQPPHLLDLELHGLGHAIDPGDPVVSEKTRGHHPDVNLASGPLLRHRQVWPLVLKITDRLDFWTLFQLFYTTYSQFRSQLMTSRFVFPSILQSNVTFFAMMTSRIYAFSAA